LRAVVTGNAAYPYACAYAHAVNTSGLWGYGALHVR
jgi:hypothetical protein